MRFCTQQMALIEQNPGFAEAGITVLPIVMNTAAQIHRPGHLRRHHPYLLDDGTVSKAYDTLGKGMHRHARSRLHPDRRGRQPALAR